MNCFLFFYISYFLMKSFLFFYSINIYIYFLFYIYIFFLFYTCTVLCSSRAPCKIIAVCEFFKLSIFLFSIIFIPVVSL